jgi:hypothetical protein
VIACDNMYVFCYQILNVDWTLQPLT